MYSICGPRRTRVWGRDDCARTSSRWGAVWVGFIGVLIILRPGTGVFQFQVEVLTALTAAAMFAGYLVLTRVVGQSGGIVVASGLYTIYRERRRVVPETPTETQVKP